MAKATAVPKLRLEWRKASELQDNPHNWRKHPASQTRGLKAVLDKVGWAGAVLYNETTGHLIDGHLRKAVSGDQEVPVLVGKWSEEQEKVILATLDPIAAMAEADKGILKAILDATGPQGDEIDHLLASVAKDNRIVLDGDTRDAEPQIDQAEELNKKWQVKTGDLWQIGEHRLLCGDATKGDDVAEVLAEESELLCVTDPPYGVKYNPRWRSDAAAKGHLAYAARRIGAVTNDDRSDWREAWLLFPGDVIYSWHPAVATSLVHAAALEASGFDIRIQIIWAKSNFPIGRGDYHVRHEPCWYAVRSGKLSHRTNDRTQTTLWEIPLDRNCDGGHSTQKPLECMARPIRNHEFELVYDPFLGSGTTMVACENLGRKCRAIEISPAYCAVALERMTTAFPGIEVKRG
jgi:DNA modification methylase